MAHRLEPRQLLSAVVLDGDGGNDTFTIRRAGDLVQFFVNQPTSATPVQTVPVDQLGGIIIRGEGGDDTLVVDYSGGDPVASGLTFVGGTANTAVGDRLVLTAATGPTTVAFTGNGQVAVGGSVGDMIQTYNTTAFDVGGLNAPATGGTLASVGVQAGSVTIADDLGTATTQPDVAVAAGATLSFAAAEHLGNVSVAAGGTLNLLPAGGEALVARTLTAGGTLDLADNDLIVTTPSAADVTTLQEAVAAGVTGSATQGIIFSSTAAADGRTIGVAPVDDLYYGPAAIDGQPLPHGGLVARYTAAGDANLDGFVNSEDLNALGSHYGATPGTTPPAWYEGDFNYDGIVDSADFTQLAAHYNTPTDAQPLPATAGQPFTVSLPPQTPAGAAVARWDVDWGDGTVDSYGPGTAAATHAYTATGPALIQLTAVTAAGATYLAPATAVAVDLASATVAIDLRAGGRTDAFDIAAGGDGNTYFSRNGTVEQIVPTADLLSVRVTGASAGSLTVDFSAGNPLPAAGLYFDGQTLTVTDRAAGDTLATTATAAVLGTAELRHPATTAVRFAAPGSDSTLVALGGTTTVADDATNDLAVLENLIFGPVDFVGPSVAVAPGATVAFAGNVTLSALTVAPGGTARVVADGTHVLTTNSLNLAPADAADHQPAGLLDLADNDLIVRGGDLAAVTAAVAAGYDGGRWDGGTNAASSVPAIVSSAARLSADQTTLAVAQVGQPNAPLPGPFDDQLIRTGDVLVRYTWPGDANLDGTPDNAAAPVPPALVTTAEGSSTVSVTLPTDAVLGDTNLSDLFGWVLHWGDGTSDTYPVPYAESAGNSYPPLVVSHTYTQAAVAVASVSIWADGDNGAGLAAQILLPHQSLLTAVMFPLAPTDPSAIESRPNEVDLTWTELSAVADTYKIVATPAGGGPPIVVTVAAGSGGGAVTGLTPGVPYTFAIKGVAHVIDGEQLESPDPAVITATASAVALTVSCPAVVGEGASVPVTLTVGAGGTTPLAWWHLQWANGGADDPTGAPAAGSTTTNYTPPPWVASDTASVTVTDQFGTTFTLPSVTVGIRPTAPDGLVVSDLGGKYVTLAWSPHSQAATGYDILRDDGSGGGFAEVGWVSTDGSSVDTYTDDSVFPGATYRYEVTAASTSDETASLPAGLAQPVTTPTEQLTLTVTQHPNAKDAVDLNWMYAAKDESGYELEIKDTSAGENFHTFDTLGPATGGVGAEVDVPLVWGDTYQFRIRADRADGTVTDYTPPVPYTVPILPAPTLDARTVTDGSRQHVQLYWSDVPNGGQVVAIQMRASDSYPDQTTWRNVGYGDISNLEFGWVSQMVSTDGDKRFGPLYEAPADSQGLALDPGVRTFGAGHFEYRIRGSDADGEPTLWSQPQDVSIQDGVVAESDRPVVTSFTDTTITVEWTDKAPAYYNEISDLSMEVDGHPYDFASSQPAFPAGTGGDAVAYNSSVPVSVNQTFTFVGLEPGTTYDFSFAVGLTGSFAPDGNGSASGNAPTTWSFYTFSQPTTGVATLPTPAAPRAIAAVRDPNNPNLADVHWINTPDNETSFVLQESVDGGKGWTTVAKPAADKTSAQVDISQLHPGEVEFQVMSAAPNSAATGPATLIIPVIMLIAGHQQGTSGTVNGYAGVQLIHDLLLGNGGGFAKNEVVNPFPSDSVVGSNPNGSQAAAVGALANVEGSIVQEVAGANGQVLHLAMVGYSLGGGLIYDALTDIFTNPAYAGTAAKLSVDSTTYIDAVLFNRGKFVWGQVANLATNKGYFGQFIASQTNLPPHTANHFNYYQSLPDTEASLNKKYTGIKNAVVDAADGSPHGGPIGGSVVRANDDLDQIGSMNSWPFRKTFHRNPGLPLGRNSYDHISIDREDLLHRKVVYDLEGIFGRSQPITM